MNTQNPLTTLAIVTAMLVLASFLELAWPRFARPANRRRLATNLSINALTLALNGVLTVLAALAAVALGGRGPDLFGRLGLPFAAQVALGFVVLDFSFGYFAHRALHAVPFLWRAHRVHHADPFVDATTGLRNHPIEGVWRFVCLLVPIALLGIPAEAVGLQRLLTAINGALEHGNIRLWSPLDRALSWLWVTPDMHKIHHSRVPAETDTNFGNILSVYDRLFATFTPTERARFVRYGLDDVDAERASSLGAMLALPFERDARAASSAARAS